MEINNWSLELNKTPQSRQTKHTYIQKIYIATKIRAAVNQQCGFEMVIVWIASQVMSGRVCLADKEWHCVNYNRYSMTSTVKQILRMTK